MKRRGFTLIELLVVIAIIALLLAVLIPSLQIAKEMAQGAVCLANLRGLSLAWYQYAENNDSRIARCNQGPSRWVDRPHQLDPVTGARTYTDHDSTVSEKENGIMGGVLFPYAEATKVYHCPADKRYVVNVNSRGKGPYRSYAMPESLGEWTGPHTMNSVAGAPSRTFRPVVKYSDMVTPSAKWIYVEENYTHSPGRLASLPPDMGYNNGVWSFWRGDRLEAWWDPLAPWHNDRTNLGFADGHGEKFVWKDDRTVWFAYDRMDPRLGTTILDCATQINNQDQQYMTSAYPSGR